ncbi:MAG: hypothetical protein KGS72_13060 [Cyanobacteria bacterium REEB67]|nr:hypothetical protein [Cyanobacteria bacterium REEB67]
MSSAATPSIKYLGRNADGSSEYSMAVATGAELLEYVITVAARNPKTDLVQQPAVTSAGSNISPDMRTTIENFDKAGHIMMFEHGDVEAAAPFAVPEKMRPIEIVALAEDKNGMFPFDVTLETASGNIRYRFNVTAGPTPGLHWEKNFTAAMGGSTHFATPLLDAIIGFFEVNNRKSISANQAR